MGNVKQKGKYYMTKKTIICKICKFIKNFILYIVYVLALAYLDKTNIRESYLYILIILGIPLITVCYISDIIIDKIEKHLDIIKKEGNK